MLIAIPIELNSRYHSSTCESEQPGAVTLYEGWWPRQFMRGKGVNELTSSAVNPIHEVHFVGNMWAPSTGWKDCRCQVAKAEQV